MERGVFSKVEQIQPYMCGLFAKVKGGKEGVAAAKKGAGAANNEATGNQDVFMFSRMIAGEANKNAIAVNARHKGRKYTLTGRIETLSGRVVLDATPGAGTEWELTVPLSDLGGNDGRVERRPE